MTLAVLHHAVSAILQAVPAPHPADVPQAPTMSTNLGGCTDSPEAATSILMAVGLLGIYYGSTLARKFRRNG